MLRRFGIYSDEMAVALVVWLCTLPLLGLLIVPRFGLPAAGFAALLTLIALMIVCWGMCGRELARPDSSLRRGQQLVHHQPGNHDTPGDCGHRDRTNPNLGVKVQ